MKLTRLIGIPLAAVLALPSAARAGVTPLLTQVMVKVGAPASGGHGPLVKLVPGTVIAVGTNVVNETGARLWLLEDMKLNQQLEDTFRITLDPRKGASKTAALKPGDTLTLDAAGGVVRVEVALDEIEGDLAAYRVAFVQGARVLSETPVSVKAGSRAVVGARDGKTAPYIFVVVEPVHPGKNTPVRVTKDSGLTRPRLLQGSPPKYPEDARKDKVEGPVILQLLITAAGDVKRVRVLRSPDDRLSEAARTAVRTWKFEPARTPDGEAVSAIYTLAVKFRLK